MAYAVNKKQDPSNKTRLRPTQLGTSSDGLIVIAPTDSHTGITIQRRASGSTGHLLSVQDQTGAELTYIAADGSLHGTTLAGAAVASGSAPSTATSPGTAGQIAYDATHLYICINTNVWVRCTLATW